MSTICVVLHLFFKSCGCMILCKTSNTSISRLYAHDWRLRQQICCSCVLEWRNTTSVCMRFTSSCDREGNWEEKSLFLWRSCDRRSASRGILLEKAQHAHRRKLNLYLNSSRSVLISIVSQLFKPSLYLMYCT